MAKPAAKPNPLQTRRAAQLTHRARQERFRIADRAERAFAQRLTQIARVVGHIVKDHVPPNATQEVIQRATTALRHILDKYADTLFAWAGAMARRMHAEVDRRDRKAWIDLGRTMGRELRNEIDTAPTGALLRRLLSEQVGLITSLPRNAAMRVHELTLKAVTTGARPAALVEEILRTGDVTRSRAILIARTETARTSSLLTQVRAMSIGAEGYVWRTAKDADVRPEHQRLEGKFIKWSDPPVAGKGKGGADQHYHAGQGPNCRCWIEPVLPDLDKF